MNYLNLLQNIRPQKGNRLLKLLIGLVLFVFLCVVSVNYFCFDTFVEKSESDIPLKTISNIKKGSWAIYYGVLGKYGIRRSTEESLNIIQNLNTRISYLDLDHVLYADSSVLIIGHGPNTMESGWRFVFLPSYTTIDVLDIHKLTVLHTFRFWGYITGGVLDNQNFYFRFNDGSFGCKEIIYQE